MTRPSTSLSLQPLVHVEDMAASIAFYEQLGARLIRGSADGDWALLEIGTSQLSLLAHPPNPAQGDERVELTFQAAASLDDLAARLSAAGVSTQGPEAAEAFGRQLQLRSPDGLLVKVNQIRDDL